MDTSRTHTNAYPASLTKTFFSGAVSGSILLLLLLLLFVFVSVACRLKTSVPCGSEHAIVLWCCPPGSFCWQFELCFAPSSSPLLCFQAPTCKTHTCTDARAFELRAEERKHNDDLLQCLYSKEKIQNLKMTLDKYRKLSDQVSWYTAAKEMASEAASYAGRILFSSSSEASSQLTQAQWRAHFASEYQKVQRQLEEEIDNALAAAGES